MMGTKQPAGASRGVDALPQRLESDATVLELLDEFDQVLDAAAGPVELRDHQDIAGTQVVEAGVPLRPAGEPALTPWSLNTRTHPAAVSWAFGCWSLAET